MIRYYSTAFGLQLEGSVKWKASLNPPPWLLRKKAHVRAPLARYSPRFRDTMSDIHMTDGHRGSANCVQLDQCCHRHVRLNHTYRRPVPPANGAGQRNIQPKKQSHRPNRPLQNKLAWRSTEPPPPPTAFLPPSSQPPVLPVISKDGREDVRKKGREDGREDGREEGRKGGRKEGGEGGRTFPTVTWPAANRRRQSSLGSARQADPPLNRYR